MRKKERKTIKPDSQKMWGKKIKPDPTKHETTTATKQNKQAQNAAKKKKLNQEQLTKLN
jgi:hypothetical protein